MNASTPRNLVRGLTVAGAVATCALLGTGIAAAATPADSGYVMTLAPDNGGPSLVVPVESTDTEVTLMSGSDGQLDHTTQQADLNNYTEVDNKTYLGFTVTVTDNGVVVYQIPLAQQADLFFRA